MSAIADISLNDSQATPVAHIFEPVKQEPGLVTYHDKTSGVGAGFGVLTLGNRLPSSANRNYKAVIKIRTPILETSATASSGFTPGPTIAYELMAKLEFVFPDRATRAERDDIRMFLANAIQHLAIGEGLVEEMALPY